MQNKMMLLSLLMLIGTASAFDRRRVESTAKISSELEKRRNELYELIKQRDIALSNGEPVAGIDFSIITVRKIISEIARTLR